MDAENAEINELIRKVVHDLLGLKAYTLLFQTAFQEYVADLGGDSLSQFGSHHSFELPEVTGDRTLFENNQADEQGGAIYMATEGQIFLLKLIQCAYKHFWK